MLKVCTKCKQEKPVSEFYRSTRASDGYQYWCKDCDKSHKTPGKFRKADLKRRYGISPEEVEALLKSQEGRCAICGTDDPNEHGVWHVDHNHATGAVRGLLCRGCNIGIGQLKEDSFILESAIVYLQKYS